MPIEFARISRDRRLTLVIHPGSEDQTTYWAVSELTALDEARNNVRAREDSRLEDIHYVLHHGGAAETANRDVVKRMSEWLARHEDVEAVVWTGLPSNWPIRRQCDFTPEDAVEFVAELEGAKDQATYARVREYVTNAPPQIDTVVRRALRQRGWGDTHLSPILFED